MTVLVIINSAAAATGITTAIATAAVSHLRVVSEGYKPRAGGLTEDFR
jgi:hypothetical protein